MSPKTTLIRPSDAAVGLGHRPAMLVPHFRHVPTKGKGGLVDAGHVSVNLALVLDLYGAQFEHG